MKKRSSLESALANKSDTNVPSRQKVANGVKSELDNIRGWVSMRNEASGNHAARICVVRIRAKSLKIRSRPNDYIHFTGHRHLSQDAARWIACLPDPDY